MDRRRPAILHQVPMRLIGLAVILAVSLALAPLTAPAADAPYSEETMSFTSGGVRLRGVLARPHNDGPFAAYVHVHGSATVQMASSPPWTSFVQGSYLEALAREGYVVLRLARRGHFGSEGTTYNYSLAQATGTIPPAYAVFTSIQTDADDVLAALAYLRTLPYIDPERLAVGGHSVGGLVSVLAGARESRLRAVVSLAGGFIWREGGRETSWSYLDRERWRPEPPSEILKRTSRHAVSWVLMGPMFSLPSLDSTLGVLSAMVTPAVMILATSSLILTTTSRLVRIVDRVREMLPEFEALTRSERPDESKMAMLFDDLGRATIRARLGQQALAQLYLGLGAFLATSITLGVVTFARLDAGWMPLLFGAIGVVLLFSASILLIFESRIALASAYAEMDYIRRIASHLARPELRKTRRWWMLR